MKYFGYESGIIPWKVFVDIIYLFWQKYIYLFSLSHWFHLLQSVYLTVMPLGPVGNEK